MTNISLQERTVMVVILHNELIKNDENGKEERRVTV